MSREDLIGQMQGLSEELAAAVQYGRTDRAEAVREYMGTVRAAGARRADALDAEADRLDAVGQHMGAGQRREGAAALRAGLGITTPTSEPDDDESGPDDDDETDDDQDDESGPPEDTAESTPRETAVPAKVAKKAAGRKPGRPKKGG